MSAQVSELRRDIQKQLLAGPPGVAVPHPTQASGSDLVASETISRRNTRTLILARTHIVTRTQTKLKNLQKSKKPSH
ncbi:hypothetical protein CHS0354_033516 [Potamilus streckersoni]|uniref:Uncharacterized protein n=1 Tax=Potamilus streckersoni TaxID=2493646 RepID=A0AAE0SB78_9BIVA|nr:hypothetical protein CHS0354_033516 [Potamilus streckersoni]